MADRSPNLLSGNERNQIQGANIGTQRAQHALVHIQLDIGETPEAAGRFASGLLLGEPEFNFCQPDASVGGNNRYIEPVPTIVCVVEAVELLQLDELTFLVVRGFAREVRVNRRSHLAAVGYGENQSARTMGGVTPGPNAV
jgi:hypothetical protein